MLNSYLSFNTNLLQPHKFRVTFSRFPNVTYRCTSTSLPGISLGRIEQPSPFVTRPLPGDKLIYDDLELTFQVDENLKNWLEIHDWMRAIGKPTSYSERQKIQPNAKNVFTGQVYCDAVVIPLSSQNNPLYEIQYKDCWPQRLTPIKWAVNSSSEEIIIATVTLPYLYYDIVPIKTDL